ncbi:MAG TPA: hypothetical protein VED87_07345 [Methylocystis sp.]|nr:hypothetical protein [Methylocystis sp.]
MKRPSYGIAVAAMCLCALLFSDLAAAAGATGSALSSSLFPSAYTLAKAGAPDFYSCKAKCRKDYRRCYSEGNQVGKPYVTGGQPCSEQRVTCIRACKQQQ